MDESIWVVAQGMYSDYRVLCACPSKEDAELVVAKYNASGGSHYEEAVLEELPLIDRNVQRIEVLRLTANLWDDGTAEETQILVRVEWPFALYYPHEAKPVHWRWVRAPIHKGKGGRLEVGGSDHERVRRVFSDRKAMILSGEPLQRRTEAEGAR